MQGRHATARILLIVFIAISFAVPVTASTVISEFFSDFTTSDVTIISDNDFNGTVVFELYYSGNFEDYLGSTQSQKIPIHMKANEPSHKVIVWQQKPQHDYYTAKASLYNNDNLLDTVTYQVSYGTATLSGFYVVDFSPSNSGVQLLLRPFNPSVADIQIELLDDNDVVYTKTNEDVSLTVNKEIKMTWPFLLTKNKKYTVRAKVYTHRLYFDPLVNSYISGFTATEDADILHDDVEVDEFGASVTIEGKSQVPFDGYIVVKATNRETGEIKSYRQQMEEILVSGKEDTAGVVWGDLAPGTYDVEIRAVNKENYTLDKYETVLRIPEIPVLDVSETSKESPGFLVIFSLISFVIAARSRRGA